MEKGLLSLFTAFRRLSHEQLGVTTWAICSYDQGDFYAQTPLLFLEYLTCFSK